MKAVLVVGGVLFALGLALMLPALVRHEGERGEWRQARLEMSTSAYDAAQSDMLYRRVQETRKDAEHGGFAVILGVLLMLAAWTPAEAGPPPKTAIRVTIVDGLAALALFTIAFFGDPWLWDSSETAFGAAIQVAAPLLLLLPHASLLAGRSLGLSLARGRLPSDRALRLRAAFLGPVALPLLVLTFWSLGRFPRLAAIHLPGPATPEKQAPPSI